MCCWGTDSGLQMILTGWHNGVKKVNPLFTIPKWKATKTGRFFFLTLLVSKPDVN